MYTLYKLIAGNADICYVNKPPNTPPPNRVVGEGGCIWNEWRVTIDSKGVGVGGGIVVNYCVGGGEGSQPGILIGSLRYFLVLYLETRFNL